MSKKVNCLFSFFLADSHVCADYQEPNIANPSPVNSDHCLICSWIAAFHKALIACTEHRRALTKLKLFVRGIPKKKRYNLVNRQATIERKSTVRVRRIRPNNICIITCTTVLHMACLLKKDAVVEFLITECGALLECKTTVAFSEKYRKPPSVTPLWLSVKLGDASTVRCLLAHGACANPNVWGATQPIHMACAKGDHECMRILLQNGCSANVQDIYGKTPLVSVTETQIEDTDSLNSILSTLLDAGADVLISDHQGRTALSYSAEKGRRWQVEKLLCHSHPIDVLEQATYYAAIGNHRPLVEYMTTTLDLGVDILANALDLIGTKHLFYGLSDQELTANLWKEAYRLRRRYRQRHGNRRRDRQSDKDCQENSEDVTEYTKMSPCFITEDQIDQVVQSDEVYMFALLMQEKAFGPASSIILNSLLVTKNIALSQGRLSTDKKAMVKICLYFLEKYCQIHRCSGIVDGQHLTFMKMCVEHIFATCQIDDIEASMGSFYTETLLSLLSDVMYLTSSAQEMQRPLLGNQIDLACQLLDIIFRLISLVHWISPNISVIEKQQLKRASHELVKLRPTDDRGNSILHCLLTSSGLGAWRMFVLPNLSKGEVRPLLEYLLTLGLSPDATNIDQDTVLHIVIRARMETKSDYDHSELTKISRVLLGHGAHTDIRSHRDGLVPLKHLNDMSLDIMSHVRLYCLAARAVVSNKVGYKTRVPSSVAKFIELH